MKYRSVFDIIGPVMVGPSSSHTAGAVRIGLFTRHVLGKEPEKVRITLYGSFKDTYKGHGTDIALIGGLLGYNTSDKRIRTSMETADEKGIDYEFIESEIEHVHPNTAKIEAESGGESIDIIGKSIGGGKMVIFELLGFDVSLSGDFPTYFIFYTHSEENKEQLSKVVEEIIGDKVVTANYSSSILEGVNLLTIEAIEILSEEILDKIKELSYVTEIKFGDKL